MDWSWNPTNFEDTKSTSSAASFHEDPKIVIHKLRSLNPYLQRRLQYILEFERAWPREPIDEDEDFEVKDIKFYLELTTESETVLIYGHGIEKVKEYVEKINAIMRQNPIPPDFKTKDNDGNFSFTNSNTSNADENMHMSWTGDDGLDGCGKTEKEKLPWEDEMEEFWGEQKPHQDEPTRKFSTNGKTQTSNWYENNRSSMDNVPDNKSVNIPTSSSVSETSIPNREEQKYNHSKPTPPNGMPLCVPRELDVDPLVRAGLMDVFERRDNNVKPIFKDPRIRPNPVFQPPLPNSLEHKLPQNPPNVTAPNHVSPSFTDFPAWLYDQPDKGPGMKPNSVSQSSNAPNHQQQPKNLNASAPNQVPPSCVNKPTWFCDQPLNVINAISQQTSYDCARNFSSDAVPRQRPLTTTYVPGYGHISIMAPLIPAAPPIQPQMSVQQYEYQVPREVYPNPCYDPIHQPQPGMCQQPVVVGKFTHDMGHPQRTNFPRFVQTKKPHPMTPAPGPSSLDYMQVSDEGGPDSYNSDHEISMSPTSAASPVRPLNRKVRFQRNDGRSSVKSGGDYNKALAQNFKNAVKRPNEPPKNTGKSELRRKLENECSGQIFRLGQHKKITEKATEEPAPSPSSASDNDEDCGKSPSPEPNVDDGEVELLRKILCDPKNKRERERLAKNPAALKLYWKKIKADDKSASKQTKRSTKETEQVPPAKKTRTPQQKKKKDTGLTSLKSSEIGSNGLSSESETGSVVSTRSSTRARSCTTVNGKDSRDTSSGKATVVTPREKSSPNVNKARKSAGGTGKTGKSYSANSKTSDNAKQPATRNRKRIISPLDSASENEGTDTHEDYDNNTSPETEKVVISKAKLAKVVVDEMRNEINQKKLKKTKKMNQNGKEDDHDELTSQQNYWFAPRAVNAQGGQRIGRNDILVTAGLNKIYVENECAAEADKMSVLKTEKIKRGDIEREEENDDGFNDPFLQFRFPEVEVIINEGEESVASKDDKQNADFGPVINPDPEKRRDMHEDQNDEQTGDREAGQVKQTSEDDHNNYKLDDDENENIEQRQAVPNKNISEQQHQTMPNENIEEHQAVPIENIEQHQAVPNENIEQHQAVPNENIKQHQAVPNENIKQHQAVPNENIKQHQAVPIENIEQHQTMPNKTIEQQQAVQIENIEQLQTIPNENIEQHQTMPYENIEEQHQTMPNESIEEQHQTMSNENIEQHQTMPNESNDQEYEDCQDDNEVEIPVLIVSVQGHYVPPESKYEENINGSKKIDDDLHNEDDGDSILEVHVTEEFDIPAEDATDNVSLK